MTGKLLFGFSVVLLYGSLLTSPNFVHATITYKTVALSGSAANGLGPDIKYKHFFDVNLHPGGRISFRASLTGPGIDTANDTALWIGAADSPVVTVREGDQAPGTDTGVTFSSLSSPWVNYAGQIAFEAGISGPGVDSTNFRGIWSGEVDDVSLLVLNGSHAPGTETGVNFRQFSLSTLTNDGQVVVSGDLIGGGVEHFNNSGFWQGVPDHFRLRWREGSQAPGLPAGVTFFDPRFSFFDSSARFVMQSNLLGPGIELSNRMSIWIGSEAGLDLIVRSENSAPGGDDGATVLGPFLTGFSEQGHVTFVSDLGDGAGQLVDRSVIWAGKPESLQIVARAGDQAPGMEPGVVFWQTATGSVPINNAGQIAFNGFVVGPGVTWENDQGYWAGVPGELKLIARSGDQAPGTEEGVVFQGDSSLFPLAAKPSINDVGQIVLSTFLTGPGVDSSNDFGVWVTDTLGRLKLIARTGDKFDVNDTPEIEDLRTISRIENLHTPIGSDIAPRSFNDDGELVLRLKFTDGYEGIFIATIPEPGTVILIGIGSLWMVGCLGRSNN